MVHHPTNLTVYYVNNCRQTEKDEKLESYVDITIIAQFSRIKNASEKEIEMQGKNKQIQILFFCTFPEYKKGTDKLLGVTEHVCLITVLGDKFDEFFSQWVRW